MGNNWGSKSSEKFKVVFTNELSALLWKERELLELLQFKLDEQHLLFVAGKTRWLSMATREIENVLEKVNNAGLVRAIEASKVAIEWGLDSHAPLSEIAKSAPEGIEKDLLSAHLTALRQTTEEIARLRESNEQYLRAAHRSAQETLAQLGTDPTLYGRTGEPDAQSSAAQVLDTNL